MGPLDMRGLVGAATIMGCLKCGACFSGLDANDQIDLFEKDSFLFVKCALPPFAFVTCLRDFQKQLDFGKTTSLYTNELSNPNLV